MDDWSIFLPEISSQMIVVALSSFFLGALSGAFLQHRARAKRASEAFTSAFFEALSGMYPTPSNWPSDVKARLRDVYPKLEQAVEAFRPHLSWWRRRAFDRAWFIYRLGEDGREIDVQLYHQYMGIQESGQAFINPQRMLQKNVLRLLAFAEKA
ncbi:hypothetical protein [Xanthomonas fragariae]|uniref:hypothetical protein n=1 Tax=Xanthomonas fragariae TaxID=48664 RepID=UPI0022AB35A7|nr:hypothetical protein [Xanthomonas fragariae]WAT15081.1 hypothetical protein OZ429_00415 [Xanthomonas fragariae]